jgi:hypothetical protein
MAKVYIIRSFARPSSTLLYLQVGAETGKTRFIVRHARRRQVETVDLSVVATEEILTEIREKSGFNARYGFALQTVSVSEATKNFIFDCWSELKTLKPNLCIK